MSARLDWRPTRNDWKSTSGQSNSAAAIERAFGRFPEQLGKANLETLRGIAAAEPYGPWVDLIEAIEEHGSIDIMMSY